MNGVQFVNPQPFRSPPLCRGPLWPSHYSDKVGNERNMIILLGFVIPVLCKSDQDGVTGLSHTLQSALLTCDQIYTVFGVGTASTTGQVHIFVYFVL